MSILENFVNAFQVIILNKLRAWLSMLWIIIWVASVIIMISIWNWATQSIVSRVQSLGTNLITITPWGQNSTNARLSAVGGSNTTQVLESEHVDAIKSLVSNLSWVAPEINSRKQVIYWNNNTNTRITWVTPDYEIVRNFKVNYWQFITQENIKNVDKVATLWISVAKTLFGTDNPIGKDIIIGNSIFTVVWVMEEKWSQWFSNTDDVIFIPITTAERIVIWTQYYNSISVSVSDWDKMTEVKNQIEAVLMSKMWVTDISEANFTIQNQADALSAVWDITRVLTLFLGWIAAISLIVWGIWVMNIMLVSVTERIHEIGIRKAIWATRFDILSQFLVESIVLSILGGCIWILISYGVILIIQKLNLLTVAISPNSVLLSFGFSAFIWIFFGILPAYKAAKLKPIEALRFE